MTRIHAAISLLVFLSLFSSPARGARAFLHADRDNSIFAEDSTLSNGAGESFHAGRNGLGSIRRGLVRFNVASALPAGAIVDSVVLTLRVSQTQLGSHPVALHRLLADWGEGTSDAPFGEGQGTQATPGDATWTDTFYPASFWAAPGGDFDPAPSAVRPVGPIGFYSWRSAAMTAEVVDWLANPGTNFGWILIGDEAVPAGGAKRFDSHQNLTPGNRPVLTVYYEPPTAVTDRPIASARLLPAVPNPFNPATTIRYELASPRYVRLAVYDAQGRLVRVLKEGMAPRGSDQVVWRGDDHRGERVASGVYLVRLTAGSDAPATQKVVLLK